MIVPNPFASSCETVTTIAAYAKFIAISFKDISFLAQYAAASVESSIVLLLSTSSI